MFLFPIYKHICLFLAGLDIFLYNMLKKKLEQTLLYGLGDKSQIFNSFLFHSESHQVLFYKRLHHHIFDKKTKIINNKMIYTVHHSIISQFNLKQDYLDLNNLTTSFLFQTPTTGLIPAKIYMQGTNLAGYF